MQLDLCHILTLQQVNLGAKYVRCRRLLIFIGICSINHLLPMTLLQYMNKGMGLKSEPFILNK